MGIDQFEQNLLIQQNMEDEREKDRLRQLQLL